MRRVLGALLTAPLLAFLLSACAPAPPGDLAPSEPLASWDDGPARRALLSFVQDVTRDGGPRFVPAPERIAVFDNDGTLWPEQPLYVQLAFTLERIEALAPEHPEWRTEEPFRSALQGDRAGLAATGYEGLLELLTQTHSGMTTEKFEVLVRHWLQTARHPDFHRPYTELAYRPMKELLQYLRDNGFRTYIVSGGGTEFMRPWTEEIYGVPPEMVVGSSIELRYAIEDGKPALERLPEVAFINDGPGKPVGIHRHIGRRPILAFGNSDGDLQMLEWTTSGGGPGLGLLLHHDDAERERAYDRDSHVGRLERGLDEAPARGWVIVSMKDDWKTVFSD